MDSNGSSCKKAGIFEVLELKEEVDTILDFSFHEIYVHLADIKSLSFSVSQ